MIAGCVLEDLGQQAQWHTRPENSKLLFGLISQAVDCSTFCTLINSFPALENCKAKDSLKYFVSRGKLPLQLVLLGCLKCLYEKGMF